MDVEKILRLEPFESSQLRIPITNVTVRQASANKVARKVIKAFILGSCGRSSSKILNYQKKRVGFLLPLSTTQPSPSTEPSVLVENLCEIPTVSNSASLPNHANGERFRVLCCGFEHSSQMGWFSLRACLDARNSHILLPKVNSFRQRQRLGLMLEIAVGVLQLHTAGWLPGELHSSDILFHHDPSAVEMGRAYISKTFSPRTTKSSQQATIHDLQSADDPDPFIMRKGLLFSLGKILLQLRFGSSWMKLKLQEDNDISERVLDSHTAKRLMGIIRDEETQRYEILCVSVSNGSIIRTTGS